MAIEKIIDQIKTISIEELKKHESQLLNNLKNEDIPEKNLNRLLSRIYTVFKITKNPKTRESFIRSYFRIFQQGIHKDGRNGSITIEITKKCNKNCKHCYSYSRGQKISMKNEMLNLIVNFARKKYKHIFLTGGEPTLDNRVFTLAKNYPDMMFFMFTNSSLITDEYAKKLSNFGNLVPLLSIDGSNEQILDCFKGKNSYKKIMKAIEHLNKNNVSWGFISMVTEKNAKDVLNPKFIRKMKRKGAFIARFLEYIPAGPKARKDLILSGETYYLLEKRKKEIIESGEIYIQDTSQKKCTGLLSFDVFGNIKNCVFFHYSKYNVNDGNIDKLTKDTIKDWVSCNCEGECPIYSNPISFKNYLEECGWKHVLACKEEYLNNLEVANQMKDNYRRFLEIKNNA